MVVARQSIALIFRGQTYQGTWHIADGVLHVESPFGCRSAGLESGERRAHLLAELMFRQLVRGTSTSFAE